MSLTVQEYQRLKTSAEASQRAADQAEGALRQVREQLRREFKVATEKEGKMLLAVMKKEEEELCRKYRRAAGLFEEKYEGKL